LLTLSARLSVVNSKLGYLEALRDIERYSQAITTEADIVKCQELYEALMDIKPATSYAQ
jgi:hypothetical protein